MDGWLRQSTAVTVPIGPFVDDANGNDEEIGLTIAQADVRLSKNGGSSAQKNNASSATHDADGMYLCPLSTTDTNTLGQLVLWVHVAGALFAKHVFHVVPSQVWDSFFGSDLLQVDVAQYGNSAGTFSGGRPEVNATHWGGTAVGSANVRADLRQAIGTTLTEGAAGRMAGSISTMHNVASPVLTTASINQTGDSYARLGTPAGASVSADVAAIKTDTGNLVTRITSTLFSGITSLAQWLGLIAGKQTGNSTARTELRATGAGSGTYDETTDSLEALKDDQMTAQDLEDAVWEAAKADHNTADTMGEALQDAGGAGTPPTVEEIRAEMDTNSTKLAAILEDTGTTLPATLSSMDGKLDTIDNFLDTEIASIISSLSTIAGYLDTEIAAILADTNELQTDWANGGRLDLLIDAIKAVTDALPNAGALSSLAQDSTVAKEATLTSTGRGDPSALAGAIGSISLAAKVDWIFAAIMRAGSFNKTTGVQLIKNSAGTDIAKATAADDGTTTSRGAYGAP